MMMNYHLEITVLSVNNLTCKQCLAERSRVQFIKCSRSAFQHCFFTFCNYFIFTFYAKYTSSYFYQINIGTIIYDVFWVRKHKFRTPYHTSVESVRPLSIIRSGWCSGGLNHKDSKKHSNSVTFRSLSNHSSPWDPLTNSCTKYD